MSNFVRDRSASAKLCTLMVHSPSHNAEELQLNPDIFSDLTPGDFIQIYDPQNSECHLVLKVPAMPPITSRLEISMTKAIAEANNLKPFAKVVIEKINPESAMMDFVELSFKRQYLQRGNFFRFQNEMIGRPIYLNQSITINGIQTQIQELRKDFEVRRSGIISDRTKFVFRSRSARIIWLVQISAEMWEFDQYGDLYFEKFLRDFVSPLLDKWKVLGASHMLTVVFFSRTLFLERVTSNVNPELYSKKSFSQTSDGFQYQDNFKIVIENIAEFDQTTQINRLRQEFWDYPRRLGWRVPQHLLHSQRPSVLASLAGAAAAAAATAVSPTTTSAESAAADPNSGNTASAQHLHSTTVSADPTYAVPSDSVHGNFLEAINMSLNILSKHYLDRDLTRTNNSIVMVSAGTGVFKVRPNLNQITKQRMLDNAFGIDFISLARPIVDTVPLFLVDCRIEGVKNFYETPHWMRVSYIDCKREVSEALEALHKGNKSSSSQIESDDALWGKMFLPQPTSSLLTAQLENSGDLKQLAAAYANTLPLPLREIMAKNGTNGTFTAAAAGINAAAALPVPMTREPSVQSTTSTPKESLIKEKEKEKRETSPISECRKEEEAQLASDAALYDVELELLFNKGAPVIPTWGTVSSIPFLSQSSTQEGNKKAPSGFNSKCTILTEDLLALKSLALSSMTGAGKGAPIGVAKNKLREVIEDLPILQRESGDSVAGSLGSMGDVQDEDSEQQVHSRPTGKFITGSSYEDDERMRRFERMGRRSGSVSHQHCAQSMDASSVGEHSFLTDMLKINAVTERTASRSSVGPAALQALVGDLQDRQSALQSLSTPDKSLSREKLLELMNTHDRNIFRAAVQIPTSNSTASLNSSDLDGSTLKAPFDGTSSMQQNALTTSESAGAGASASSVEITTASERNNTTIATTTTTPAAAVSSSDITAGVEAAKKPQPLTRDQKLRAALVSGSNSSVHGNAARLKQMQQMQQMQLPPPQYSSSGSNRALSAVAQHQLRAQQESDSHSQKNINTQPTSSSHQNSIEDLNTPAKNKAGSASERGLSSKEDKGTLETPNKASAGAAGITSPVAATAPAVSTTTSSSTTNTAKKYQRLSNKSFMGVKAIAAMTASSKTTPDAIARARSANPNQQFVIVHGKIMPVHAPTDTDAKVKSEQYAQYIREYSLTHCVNPFRIRDSQSYSHSQSHNRRRWVHVFPQSKLNPAVDYSLNWKSLTQPAILPLTTDFVPSLRVMDTKYVDNGSYQLLVMGESPFATAEDLMKELICQRLTQEYQLIEDFDPTVYRRFNKTADAPPAMVVPKVTNSLLGAGPSLRRMDSVHARSKEMRNFYILSMGHRIQFMQYDEKGGVNVTIYRSIEGQIQDDEKSVYNYSYESWSAQANSFLTMTQAFHKYSNTEFRWNKLDHIVGGNIPADTSDNAMKMKRLKYTILPPEIYTEEDVNEYFAKIDLLVEFFNKYTPGSDDVVSIWKDRQTLDRSDGNNIEGCESRRGSVEKSRANSGASIQSTAGAASSQFSAIHLTMQTPQALAQYRRTDANNYDTAKLILRTAKQGNPAWVYCRYDKTAFTYKALHLEFHWVACDAWLIDDMLTVLYRRCAKWGLRICQVPQYYSTDDLNVHPFRALPFIPITKSTRESIPSVFPTTLRTVERLIFSRRNGWLFDNEYRTDWNALGMSVPSYLDRDRDLLGVDTSETSDNSGAATPTNAISAEASPAHAAKPHAFSSLSQSLSRMVFAPKPDDVAAAAPASVTSVSTAGGVSGAPAKMLGRKPARRVDRQYIYHNGLAVVRVAAQGFLWMQNTGSKVSDVNPTIEERRELVFKHMTMVTQSCEKVPICYDICIDIVERALDYAQYALMAREIIDECFSDAFTIIAHKAVQQALATDAALRQAAAALQSTSAEIIEAESTATAKTEQDKVQELGTEEGDKEIPPISVDHNACARTQEEIAGSEVHDKVGEINNEDRPSHSTLLHPRAGEGGSIGESPHSGKPTSGADATAAGNGAGTSAGNDAGSNSEANISTGADDSGHTGAGYSTEPFPLISESLDQNEIDGDCHRQVLTTSSSDTSLALSSVSSTHEEHFERAHENDATDTLVNSSSIASEVGLIRGSALNSKGSEGEAGKQGTDHSFE